MPLLKSSSKPKLRRELTFQAIGTSWQIDFLDLIEDDLIRTIKQHINQRIETYDKTYSRFRADSLITAMSAQSGEYRMPADSEALLTFYDCLYKATNGLVTPLIGQALAEAGYDSAYSLQPKDIIGPVFEWPDVVSYKDNILSISQPLTLDFGAAGKGYLVDIISDILENYDLYNYCIDASGDMTYRSSSLNTEEQFMTIGLEHPDDPSLVIGWADLESGRSLCASATNRRVWSNYNHVLNPRTRQSVKNIKATWVTAETTMIADGLATALFFVGAEKLLTYFEFEYVLVNSDNSAQISNGFKGGLYN